MDSSAYEILCWGDGLYLWRVLNGLAMLANTNNLAILAMIGCLLGLLVACVRVVITGGREFPIVSVFLGAILFSALFGPKVKVVVTPLNTAVFTSNVSGSTPPGGSYVVDNVPFIAGFLGYVMSQSGVKLTSLFETAFSTPTSVGVTNGGLGKTLSYITAVRVLADPYLPPAREGVDVATQFAYWRRSMATYIHDCTIGGMNSSATSGKPDPAKMFNTANPMEGIKFASDIWHTLVFDAASPSGRRVSCSQAFDAVAGTQESLLPAAYAQVIKARYGAGGGVAVLNDALGSIGSAAANHANAYISASMINALWTSALTSGPRTGGDPTALIALRQAEEQRTSDWIGGANLFLSSMRPVMSFFEALTYAIAPFLVFMLGLGERGWRVLGSYLLLALWVQLWLPLLAVCNLFLITGMEYVAAGLATATSVVEVNTLHAQAVHWLGVGGLFVQVTPFLALALLYGGSVTATTLAGRMAGHDYHNEKLQSPDAVQPGPVLQMRSSMHHSSGEGLVRTDAPMPTFSASDVNQAMHSSATTEHEATGQSFLRQGQLLTSKIGAWNRVATHAGLFTNSDAGSSTNAGGATFTHGENGTTGRSSETGSSTSMRADQTDRGSLSLKAAAGGSAGYDGGRVPINPAQTPEGTPKDVANALRAADRGGKFGANGTFGFGASAEQGAGSSTNVDTSGATTLAASASSNVSSANASSTTWQRANQMASLIQDMLANSGSNGLSSSDAKTLQQLASDVRTSDRSYTESQSHLSGLSAQQSVSAAQFGVNYTHVDPALAQEGRDFMKIAGVSSIFQSTYDGLDAIVDPSQRRDAATFMVLGHLGSGGDGPALSPELEARRAQLFSQIAPTIFGGSSAQSYAPVDAHANQDLAATHQQYGATRAEVEPHVLLPTGAGVAEDYGHVQALANGAISSANTAVGHASERIDLQQGAAQSRVDSTGAHNDLEAKREALRNHRKVADKAVDQMLDNAQPQTMTARIGETVNNAYDDVKAFFSGDAKPSTPHHE